jgi:formate dehydrogenase assembly factor FdhD
MPEQLTPSRPQAYEISEMNKVHYSQYKRAVDIAERHKALMADKSIKGLIWRSCCGGCGYSDKH